MVVFIGLLIFCESGFVAMTHSANAADVRTAQEGKKAK
jgi:hypothetical protein